MGSFFLSLIGIIWLCIVFGAENKSKREFNSRMSEQKSRFDKWHDRVNKGPLNNREFYEKIRYDSDFCNNLLKECNDILDSIPEMDGIRLCSPYKFDTAAIMEAIYNAKTGDVSMLWYRGYIKLYEFTDGFPRKPSIKACNAFMEWYQSELRKNGYAEAQIVSIERQGFTVGWRFIDGATSYEMIKQELYIR